MFVVLFYFEGECEVLGPFDDEDKAYAYIGRYKNGDAYHPIGRNFKSATLFVRPMKEVK